MPVKILKTFLTGMDLFKAFGELLEVTRSSRARVVQYPRYGLTRFPIFQVRIISVELQNLETNLTGSG